MNTPEPQQVLNEVQSGLQLRPRTAENQASAHTLRIWIADESLTNKAAADLLGVSPAGVAGWLRKGKMPRTVLLAIEGLQRRKRAEPTTMLVVRAGAKSELVKAMLTALDVPFKEI